MKPNWANLIRQIRGSFRAKVFFSFVASMFFIALCFDLVSIHMQKQALEADLVSDGTVLARILAHNVRLGVFAENPQQLEVPVQAFSRVEGVVEVSVLGVDGRQLLDHHPARRSGDAHSLAATPDTAFLEQVKAMSAPLFRQEKEFFTFWAPVRLGPTSYTPESLYFAAKEPEAPETAGEVIGFVRLVMDQARLRAAIRALWLQNLGVGALFLVIAALVTFLVVREVSKPLKGLIADIKARGVPVTDSGDLELVAGTYDSLVQQLGEAFAVINDLKESLERKVDARTAELASANEELEERQAILEDSNFKLNNALRDLQEAQVQLVQSEKLAALGQLVAGVAHEINNTTNFISGAIPPLARTVNELKDLIGRYDAMLAVKHWRTRAKHQLDIDRFKEEIEYCDFFENLDILLDNMREGARRTTKIVQDLKNFARPDESERRPIDIHSGLESTLTLLYNEYKYNIEVIREYDQTIPEVPSFPGPLNQVFMNIILNAIQSIKGKGKIRIKTWASDGQAHIMIKDSGHGIPAALIGKVFDPFFTTKDVGEGTGLGLSISYGIIKKHQGEIRVKSEVGQGTEFELLLPLKEKSRRK